jgi:hypothetical protein
MITDDRSGWDSRVGMRRAVTPAHVLREAWLFVGQLLFTFTLWAVVIGFFWMLTEAVR